MVWLLAYSAAFRALTVDGGKQSIPPFSFRVSNAARLNIRAISETARDTWWQAAWLNQSQIDARLPTFEAISLSARIPFGESLITLEPGQATRIIIEPVEWLQDLSIVVWYEPAIDSNYLNAETYSGTDYYLFFP
jgi:hypothetical protein